jgi:hypothetical protein
MPTASPRSATLIYRVAAVYGILALAPQYFMETRIGVDTPPPITHPEFFYGFVGLALVWQFAFLVIAGDPIRFRALMPITVLEKLSFGIPAVLLWAQGRLAGLMLLGGVTDLVLALLFCLAWVRTPTAPSD